MTVSLARLFFNQDTGFYILGSRKSHDINLMVSALRELSPLSGACLI